MQILKWISPFGDKRFRPALAKSRYFASALTFFGSLFLSRKKRTRYSVIREGYIFTL
jgi:hypothetical protein